MSVVSFANINIDEVVTDTTELPRSGAMKGFHGNKRSLPASKKWVGPPSRYAPDQISEQLDSEPQSLLEFPPGIVTHFGEG